MFFGAVAVGVLNYLFHPVLGRMLEPSIFGEVQAVISLFLQLSMFLTVFTIVTAYIVANYRDVKKRNIVVFELEKTALIVVLAVVSLALLFSAQLRDFFRFESAWPFVILGVMIALAVPFTFRTAFLRGRERFGAGTISNLLAAGGKFVFAMPLVMVGMGASGALAGVAIAQAAALGYAAVQAKKSGLYRPEGLKLLGRPDLGKLKHEIKYSLLVLVGSLAVVLQLTIDTLAVKHLFDAHTAGQYAGVSTIARILFFLTASIVQVMLPAVKLSAPKGQNRRLLIKSLLLMTGLSLPVLTWLVIFPHQSVNALMGANYAPVAGILPLLAITIFIISILNLIVSYFLAIRLYIAGMLAIIGFAASCGLIIFHHSGLQAIVESLFIGSLVSMCLIAVWAIRTRLQRGSNDEATTTLHSSPRS